MWRLPVWPPVGLASPMVMLARAVAASRTVTELTVTFEPKVAVAGNWKLVNLPFNVTSSVWP